MFCLTGNSADSSVSSLALIIADDWHINFHQIDSSIASTAQSSPAGCGSGISNEIIGSGRQANWRDCVCEFDAVFKLQDGNVIVCGCGVIIRMLDDPLDLDISSICDLGILIAGGSAPMISQDDVHVINALAVGAVSGCDDVAVIDQ